MKKLIIGLCTFSSCLQLLSQNVDLFTGLYRQVFPLIHIPSNRGAGIQLGAVYTSGVRVKQNASEIGLGWSLLGAGEITRSMVGFPDDMLDFRTYSPKDVNPANMMNIHGQGSLYPDNRQTGPVNYMNIQNYDIGYTRKGLDSTEFAFPDYDNFSVNAPGLSGQMGIKYFKAYRWDIQSYSQPLFLSGTEPPYFPPFNLTPQVTMSIRKPQFYFKGTFYDTLISRHYPNPGIGPGTPYIDPQSSITDAAYPGGSTEAYLGKHQNGSTVTDENYDPVTGRLATENIVEYFRNGEIDTANGSYTGNLAGFLDYTPTHGRPVSSFPWDGIGYFRITNSQGFTYHYALPVYQRRSISYSVPLKYDYSVPASISISDFSSPNNPLLYPGNNLVVIRSDEDNTYAIKWLLTSITGPDFVDDGNNFPDDGDKGYWIRYDYVKWSDNFVQRYPQYGYEHSYRPDPSTQDFPNYMPEVSANVLQPGLAYKLSGNIASAQVSVMDMYYLNKIRTSSHTAVLVRDVRNDEKGGYLGETVPGTAPVPSLYVKRLLLFKNNDFDNLFSTYSNPFTALNCANFSLFNFSGGAGPTGNVYNTGTIFNEGWYQGHSSWDTYVLNHVELDHDYSLCKKYHGNIQVACTTANMLTRPSAVQSALAVNDPASSGKLTLKRILNYGYQNIKLSPSTRFTYGGSGHNPDYNPIKEDYWGFYKSDATTNGYSRYTNSHSHTGTQAWSLSNITDALGGKQEILYESNTYNRVIDDESPGGVRGAAFIYRIRSAPDVTENYRVVMEEGSSSSDQLNEFVNLCAASIPGLKKRISIPSVGNGVIPFSSCSTCVLQHKGFMFGDCSVSLNTSGGTSHRVSGIITTTCTTNVNCQNPIYAFFISGKKYGSDIYGPGMLTSVSAHGGGNDTSGLTYSGNGFLMFETPVGYNVYGNGIRVSHIRTTNEIGEVYVRQYEYQDGTVLNEMDRFEYPRLRRGCNDQTPGDSPPKYTFLESKHMGPFSNAFSLGYSKVSVKDLGRVGTANGRRETYFITDPAIKSNAFSGNNQITSTYTSSTNNGYYTTAVHTVNECINRFPNIFGAVKEQRIYDKNNIMLSKTVNEYEASEQGAVVELFSFTNPYWFVSYPAYFMYFHLNTGGDPVSLQMTDALNGCISYSVNILRDIPVRLKSSTTYEMNAFSKEEILKVDELTGQAVCTRLSDMNGTTSLNYSYPAYKYCQPLEGLSVTSPEFRKLLPLREPFFTYRNKDSTLTPLSNGRSTTFSGAGYNIYSKYIKQRVYDNITKTYLNQNCTLTNYMRNRSFMFNAGKGSLNDYGLYNKSDLNANPLNFSPTYYWEPGNTAYNWKLLSEVTLIDKDKHIVETRDQNDRFSAIRFSHDGYHKTASISNCNYASFTYAGFETELSYTGTASFEGDLHVNNHSLTNSVAHTGQKSLVVSATPVRFYSYSESSPNGTLELGLMSGRIYRASVWVHNTNLSGAAMDVVVDGHIGGTPYQSSYHATSSTHLATTINDWNLIQVDFEVPPGFSTIHNNVNAGHLKIELSSSGSPVYFDDFILHPVESNFSAFVYDPRTDWLSAVLDGNGVSTRYVYDASGKKTEEWKEIPSVGFKKVKTWTYNFGRGAGD
jgi:hypothetical protein